MTEVAVPDPPPAGTVAVPTGELSRLALWAAGAREAHEIARQLAGTPFVPKSLRSNPADLLIPPGQAHDDDNRRQAWAQATEDQRQTAVVRSADITTGNVTAAILTGDELGLQPMAAMRSVDLIDGTPGMRAHAMRALLLSKGHDIVTSEAGPERVVVRGRRRIATNFMTGAAVWGEWQESVWDLARAQGLGLAGRKEWRRQPQTMLTARATGECCRLVAPDVLHGVPYAVEELGDDRDDPPTTATPAPAAPRPRGPITGEDLEARAAARPAATASTGPVGPVDRSGPDTASAQASPAEPVDSTPDTQTRRLFAIIRKLELPDRATRLTILSHLADRVITSSAELDPQEVRLCADTLDDVARLKADDRKDRIDTMLLEGRRLAVGSTVPDPATTRPAGRPEEQRT